MDSTHSRRPFPLFGLRSLIVALAAASWFLLAISSEHAANAQATHDLKPPMHLDSQVLGIDPSAIPTFIFAVAVIDKDGNLEIERSLPVQHNADLGDSDTTTELVVQNYTVMVPYTEEVDGRKVTKMRSETRSRTVPVRRVRNQRIAKKKAPKGKVAYIQNVNQSYTVEVPYVEIVDGESVTKTRRETRTRSVPVTMFRDLRPGEKDEKEDEEEAPPSNDVEDSNEEPEIQTKTIHYLVQVPAQEIVDGEIVIKTKFERRQRAVQHVPGAIVTKPQSMIETFKLADVECFDVSGEAIDAQTVKERLSEKSPVLIVNDAENINPYFAHLLKPETLFIVQPEKALKKEE